MHYVPGIMFERVKQEPDFYSIKIPVSTAWGSQTDWDSVSPEEYTNLEYWNPSQAEHDCVAGTGTVWFWAMYCSVMSSVSGVECYTQQSWKYIPDSWQN